MGVNRSGMRGNMNMKAMSSSSMLNGAGQSISCTTDIPRFLVLNISPIQMPLALPHF